MFGRLTMDAIYLPQRWMEILRRNQKDQHMVFIDKEKMHVRVPREILYKVLEKKGVWDFSLNTKYMTVPRLA